MSPYMRAYQAGIKLAELEWLSKVADGQQSMPAQGAAVAEPSVSAPTTAPVEEPAPVQAPTAPPEYFTARGGYGTMAKNLRGYFDKRISDEWDNKNISEEEHLARSNRLAAMQARLGDVTGKELSQIYGNKMFRAGDQLDMDDMLSRLDALRAGRAAPRDDYNFTDADAVGVTPRRESAQELLARIQANPGRTYQNVVGPTLNAQSAPTIPYQTPPGSGGPAGIVAGTSMQAQGGLSDLLGRRTVADNSARLQGLQRSIASGTPGQGSRFRQLGQVMGDMGLEQVNLTSPSGENFSVGPSDIAAQAAHLSPNLGRPAVLPKYMGAPTPAPQFNFNQGMMGNVMAQNRQAKSAPAQRMPSYSKFPSQQVAKPQVTPPVVASR